MDRNGLGIEREARIPLKSASLLLSQSLGSPVVAETISPVLASAPVSLADGTLRYVAIQVPTNATITGVMFYMRTVGVFTGDNTNGLALYTQSGGVMVKIRETANDENIWKNTANTWVQVPFATPAILTAGTYYVALIYNNSAQTTAPQINMTSLTSPNAGGNSPLFANSNFVTGQITGQNSFPSSQATSGVTAVAGVPYLALF